MASKPQQGQSKQNTQAPSNQRPRSNNFQNRHENNQKTDNKSKQHFKSNPGRSKPQNNPVQSSNFDTNKILNDVLSVLECPICLEFIQAPIFMCESGHNICGQCRGKLMLPICPICKTGVTGQRNYDLEKIAASMATLCSNSIYGCLYKGTPDNVKFHSENCEFKQYYCPLGREFNSCSWNGSLSHLSLHFSSAHPDNIVLKPGPQVMFDNFDLNKKDENIQLITIGKSIYLYHVKIDPNSKLAFWGVQYIGNHKNASKSKYEFTFYNSKKPKKVMSFSEECQPDNKSFQSIYDSGNCVMLPFRLLNTYMHEDKKFTFKFFIRQDDFKHQRKEKQSQSNQPNIDALSSKFEIL